jgi:hypothetical protein
VDVRVEDAVDDDDDDGDGSMDAAVVPVAVLDALHVSVSVPDIEPLPDGDAVGEALGM